MKCKNCKQEIADHSVYCNWCGTKQIKDKKEPAVPKPQIRGTKYRGQIMVDGKRHFVTADTEKEYYAKALAVKAGLVEIKNKPQAIKLTDAITKYIESKDGVLSPSTIRTYKNYQRNRFKGIMQMQLCDITDNVAQKAVNSEAKDVSSKTVKDAWHFISTVIGAYNVHLNVRLPQVVTESKNVLPPDKVVEFCESIKGTSAELPALLALHSLRMSEVIALKWKYVDLDNRYMKIYGARVLDENGDLVYKETNKNDTSRRIVPIMSDQLYEALKANRGEDEEYVVDHPPHVVARRIRKACADNGYYNMSMHSLRHTFASLGAYLKMNPDTIKAIGGWADDTTMKKIYTHTYQTDIKNAENELSEFLNGSKKVVKR